MSKNFKEGLIEAIKVAGQMIIDNAEDIAGKTEHMSYLDISVNFDPEFGSIPELNIYRTHLPTHEQLNRIQDVFEGREADEKSKVTARWLRGYNPVDDLTTFKCTNCGYDKTYAGRLSVPTDEMFKCKQCGASMEQIKGE